jgi:hypothetical protein
MYPVFSMAMGFAGFTLRESGVFSSTGGLGAVPDMPADLPGPLGEYNASFHRYTASLELERKQRSRATRWAVGDGPATRRVIKAPNLPHFTRMAMAHKFTSAAGGKRAQVLNTPVVFALSMSGALNEFGRPLDLSDGARATARASAAVMLDAMRDDSQKLAARRFNVKALLARGRSALTDGDDGDWVAVMSSGLGAYGGDFMKHVHQCSANGLLTDAACAADYRMQHMRDIMTSFRQGLLTDAILLSSAYAALDEGVLDDDAVVESDPTLRDFRDRIITQEGYLASGRDKYKADIKTMYAKTAAGEALTAAERRILTHLQAVGKQVGAYTVRMWTLFHAGEFNNFSADEPGAADIARYAKSFTSLMKAHVSAAAHLRGFADVVVDLLVPSEEHAAEFPVLLEELRKRFPGGEADGLDGLDLRKILMGIRADARLRGNLGAPMYDTIQKKVNQEVYMVIKGYQVKGRDTRVRE